MFNFKVMNKINEILNSIEEFGKYNYMFNVPRNSGEFLNFLVRIRKPKKILEIGTSDGYSTIWLGKEGNEVITIENDKNKVNLAKANFESCGLNNIKILYGDALEILEKLEEKFDFVFLDAIKSEYLKDFKKIKFEKSALVIADNIISHKDKVEDYISYVRKNHKSFLLKLDNGLEITIV